MALARRSLQPGAVMVPPASLAGMLLAEELALVALKPDTGLAPGAKVVRKLAQDAAAAAALVASAG